LDVAADHNWFGGLSLYARCPGYLYSAPDPHPLLYSNVTGEKEIQGISNKLYKISSEIDSSAYYIGTKECGAIGQCYCQYLNVDTTISIIENLKLITVGSVSSFISNSFYENQYNHSYSYAKVRLHITFNHPHQVSNGGFSYFYKPPLSTADSKTDIVVEWFNMERNLYTDIQNYINTHDWLLDKDATNYSIINIGIEFNNATSVFVNEKNTLRKVVSNLSLTLDNIRID
jgi:hypothetical protein